MAGFYLKLLLVDFAAMFAGAAVINLFKMEPSAAFLSAFYPAVSFAVFITFVVGPLHVARAKKIAGPGYGPEVYRLRQSAELTLSLDYAKLFQLAHHYLVEKAGCEILEADTRARRITAHSPMSFKNFGSLITLEFTDGSPILTGLKISSRPRLSATLIDCGENLKIVLDAKTYLLENSR